MGGGGRADFVTSTGPRSFERGGGGSLLRLGALKSTSTGPRSFERGGRALAKAVAALEVTSTGPRSFERGGMAASMRPR